jgi:hypothetical protein
VRLTKPWKIIRQDRANYHKFGKADPGDYYDQFFAIESNRELVERMIERGTIEQTAGQRIVVGDVFIRVRLHQRGSGKDSVTVTVEEPDCSN